MDIKYDEKSCGVVLFAEDNGEYYFLLLHYPNGHWDLAKGHVEEGEDEHTTALRELEEETGITDVKLLDGYRHPIAYKYLRKGKPSHKQVVFFLGKTSTKNVELSHEHQDSIWLPYEEAVAKLTFDNAKDLLRKAKDFLL